LVIVQNGNSKSVKIFNKLTQVWQRDYIRKRGFKTFRYPRHTFLMWNVPDTNRD